MVLVVSFESPRRLKLAWRETKSDCKTFENLQKHFKRPFSVLQKKKTFRNKNQKTPDPPQKTRKNQTPKAKSLYRLQPLQPHGPCWRSYLSKTPVTWRRSVGLSDRLRSEEDLFFLWRGQKDTNKKQSVVVCLDFLRSVFECFLDRFSFHCVFIEAELIIGFLSTLAWGQLTGVARGQSVPQATEASAIYSEP